MSASKVSMRLILCLTKFLHIHSAKVTRYSETENPISSRKPSLGNPFGGLATLPF